MSNVLDPERSMRTLEERTVGALQEFFPIRGKKHTLVTNKVYVGDDVELDDIPAQRRAVLRGKTWAQGIYGDFSLIDNDTGKVLDTHEHLKLVNLPKLTRRFSYIVDGTEYQADNQWRLKSGVYSRIKKNGEIEAQFNLAKGTGFRMLFEPKNQRFLVNYGTTNVLLYPVLRALGMSDDTLSKVWGPDLVAAGASSRRKGEVVKLAKALSRDAAPVNDEEAAEIVRKVFNDTRLLPETTAITLGKPYDKVNADVLFATSGKLVDINRGEVDPDNRDALRFKELWSISDHIPERIKNSARRITFKLTNNLDRKSKVNEILSSDIFNVPVKSFFTSTTLAQQGTQVNPLEMIGGFLKTTIMGTGGITSDAAISDEAKQVDNSQLGFLDPVQTPEGQRSGITTHLALGVNKQGVTPYTKVWDTRKGVYVEKNPQELSLVNVAFPDQYKRVGSKLTPVGDLVTVVNKGGDITNVTPSDVDYVLSSPKQMFSISANMIPFLASDQANRAEMASRYFEQAISLKNRENPLVQVSSGLDDPGVDTWEKIVGRFSAQLSPVAGVVTAVTKDKVSIRGKDGTTKDVQLYDNYPLNEKKSFISSTPIVSVGDKVEAEQPVADTNFTKNGSLALGVNLLVGYLPLKGHVFEDGIAISESASKKLTSEHLHKERQYLEKNMALGLNAFRSNFPGVVTDENAAKLDDDGVIKKGATVEPGEVLIAARQKVDPSKEQLLLRGLHRSLVKPYKNVSTTWDSAYKGVVTDVVRNGREVVAYVKTEESADIGDKLVGRHGNKGVITAVIPDEDMPQDKDGVPIDIALNPSGIPNRINVGQVLETSLSNAAMKTGTTVAVENFQPDNAKKIIQVEGYYRTVKTSEGTKRVWVKPHTREIGYHEAVQEALNAAGASETRELFDPATGKSLGQILSGKQYILKLVHQVDKKLRARSHGYGNDYDSSMVPKGGGTTGAAQRFGELGLYAMLAHGSTANIRDALTYKGDKAQDEVWTAIQTGQILPSPKPSFAYEKFLGYMRALGLNVEKEGNELVVHPFTDKQILALSSGEITDGGKLLRGKDLKPEKGGLFDEDVTGGPGGKKWAHLTLPEPIPNPIFEKAITSLLGMTRTDYDRVLSGEAGFDANGAVVPRDQTKNVGVSALVGRLKSLDVEKELVSAVLQLKKASKSELDGVNKKVKYLLMLKNNGLSADEAYVIRHLPVVPPILRPITAMEGGDLNIDSLNNLYKNVALLSNKLEEAKRVLPDENIRGARKDLLDAIDAYMGVSTPTESDMLADGQARPPGILTILSGKTTPKASFFHKKLLDRKQDLSMRSVIVPDLDMHLDEIGIPLVGGMKIYRPFVVQELVRMGFTPLKAREEIEKGTTLARRALEVAASKRPVLFKRDPVLHKFGIMGFSPHFIDEKAIHIHPLVVAGFGADFDGDTMSVFVPISKDAVEEAYNMMPSKHLLSPATGTAMYQPTLEGQLGLFLITQYGKATKHVFGSAEDTIKAAEDSKIGMTDVVNAGGIRTTAGRLLINKALPESVRTKEMLTDKDWALSTKTLQDIMVQMAGKAPSDYAKSIDALKSIGFKYAYDVGFSFNMSDFADLSAIRDKHLASVREQEYVIRKQQHDKRLSKNEADKRVVALYTGAMKAIDKDGMEALQQRGSKLMVMNKAGVKAGWGQIRQLLIGPLLLENHLGKTIPVAADRSYTEGARTSGYWVGAVAGRKVLLDKVMEVQKPGALNKQMANMLMTQIVTTDDCGTRRGISLDTTDSNLVDRYTSQEVKLAGRSYPAGTLVTSDLLSKMRSDKVLRRAKILVRSPLKCEARKGLCAKCYGVAEDGNPVKLGTNLGVISGAAIGERGTQLSLKNFHTGGIAGATSSVSEGLPRVTQLLKIPEVLPGSAVLSPVSAKVNKVSESSFGGYNVEVGNEEVYVPGGRSMIVKSGDTVEKGAPLTSGPIHPKELLEKRGIDAVQRYLSDEIYRTYEKERVKRRNVEVVVKGLTNLGMVTDSGDSDEFIRGDTGHLSYIAAQNKVLESEGRAPVKVTPILRGLETIPLDQTTDWLARMQYRRLKETLVQAANEGWSSNIHGPHPVPGVVYSAEFGKHPTGEGPY